MRLSHALSKFSDAGAEATCESAIQPCRSLCEAMSSNRVSQATQQHSSTTTTSNATSSNAWRDTRLGMSTQSQRESR
jgi:hypothetical protein